MDKLRRFPIVGLGASAGGVEALERFFRPFPADPGLAFVVVTHLSPTHPSHMREILARFTPMTVRAATDGLVLKANEIVVITEDTILEIDDGRLRVVPQEVGHRERKPIDVFLSALAKDQAEGAIGIILSGGDGDGTLGIKAIKGQGGLTLAQTSDGTAPGHADMPDSAIATGLVDFPLPVQDMAATLIRFAQGFDRLNLMAGAGKSGDDTAFAKAQTEIYGLLRSRIGHDFSGYKTRTFYRRVYRRMQVLQLDTIDGYLKRINNDPAEIDALFRDLLINVTSFFRDPDAFEALDRLVIPRIFEGRGADDTVRVWVPGCSTGEEVYSLAIALREHMDSLQAVPRVQIFATDIDERSLAIARAARYAGPLLDPVAPERRRRFFTKDGASYIVTKDIRELCVFSPHSLIKDPPFSRMDLVSCRNLLIYFGHEVQNQVIPTFHYALKPNGFLFLGSSENISQFEALFPSIDKKHRLFRAREDGHTPSRIPFFVPGFRTSLFPDIASDRKPTHGDTLRRVVEAHVMEHHTPPHVLVNVDGDVVYYSTRTGKYLEAAPGLPSRQLMTMARKGLRLELRAALREASETGHVATRKNIVTDADDNRVQMVSLMVEPMARREGDESLFIVLFMDSGSTLTREQALVRVHGNQDEAIVHLERELRESRERVQSMIEEYETALEELKSSNEELVSVNEELQSTNEELEASKEELQSLNEELQTVNVELTGKVDELDNSTSDLNNLFESTQIATVFLSESLHIRNFTPPMSRLFNILPTDRGRLLSDFTSRLAYPSFIEDIRTTLATGEPAERRVLMEEDDKVFLASLRPYRDSSGSFKGIIVTFVDVTNLARAEEQGRVLSEELAHRENSKATK